MKCLSMLITSTLVSSREAERWGKQEIDAFQDALAEALLERVHAPLPANDQPLSEHVRDVVEHALNTLEAEPVLAALIRADSVQLNHQHVAGAARGVCADRTRGGNHRGARCRASSAAAWRFLSRERPVAAEQDRGDERRAAAHSHRPVSVAGVMRGPPIFDLVKYVSYATGELPALRSEWVDVGGFDDGDDGYPYAHSCSRPGARALSDARLAHAFAARVRSQVRAGESTPVSASSMVTSVWRWL